MEPRGVRSTISPVIEVRDTNLESVKEPVGPRCGRKDKNYETHQDDRNGYADPFRNWSARCIQHGAFFRNAITPNDFENS